MSSPGPSRLSEASAPRVVLFLAASALLIAAAIGFGRGADAPAPPDRGTGPGEIARSDRLAAQLARAERNVGAAARRFLAAFLRYEVGELTPGVRRALLATTTSEFGKELLAAPPRRPPSGTFPPRAELRRLEISFISPGATLATVEGTAMRAGFEEEFGFVFAQTHYGWLASGASR